MATSNPKTLVILSFIVLLSASSALALYSERESEREDPKRQLQECRQRCQQEEDQRRCERGCQDKYQQQQQEEEGSRRGSSSDKQEREQEEKEEKNNPYFFDRDSFRQIVKTQHGSVGILQPFHERSKIHLGIANNRIAIFEANPHTFTLPHHLDAEAVIFVVNGRGTMTSLRGEKKQTHELRPGVIIRVEAGSIIYLVNSDKNEKLVIAKLLQPVSVPTVVQVFDEAGGENFFPSFSDEVLEAAFNSPRERIEKVFGKQRQGAIIKASEEQIKAIVRGAESTKRSKGSFNLLEKRPTHESNRGKLWEVDATDFKELRDLDLQVTFANISGGSMTVPFYNSRATKVTLVVDGRGFVEMVNPQLSKQQQQEHESEQGRGGQMYTRVSSELRTGTVFVSPPGNPTVIIADRQQNLQLLCFEINAETNNQKIYLAGRNNPLRKMEKEAIELSFDASEKEVREVLDAQKENIFVAGPEERRHQEL